MKATAFLLCLFLLACSEEPNPQPQEKDTMATQPRNIVPKGDPSNPFAPVDLSPMDISYYPADYSLSKMSGRTESLPVARVIYSRPHRQGRQVFGNLLPYGQPWRLGANESTEIEFFQPVTVGNKQLAAGRYMLYCIPEKDKWTLIFNSNLYSWGLTQNASKDLFRLTLPVERSTPVLEYFTMVFEKNISGASLIMAWEDVVVRMPILF